MREVVRLREVIHARDEARRRHQEVSVGLTFENEAVSSAALDVVDEAEEMLIEAILTVAGAQGVVSVKQNHRPCAVTIDGRLFVVVSSEPESTVPEGEESPFGDRMLLHEIPADRVRSY
jgi:hypothetical protein